MYEGRADMTSSPDDDVTPAGATRYRLRQLVLQHPPHDSDVRHCTSLKNDAESEELLKFDRQRRVRLLGRAQFFTMNNDTVKSGGACCRQVEYTLYTGRANKSIPPRSLADNSSTV